MRLAPVLLSLPLLLTLAGTAPADQIRLKDGTVLEGKIVKDTERRIIIDTDDLGPVPVSRSDIESVRREGEEPADGGSVNGKRKPGGKPAPKPGPKTDEDATEGPGEGAAGESDDGTAEEAEPLPGRLGRRRVVRFVRRPRTEGPRGSRTAPETTVEATAEAPESKPEGVGAQDLQAAAPGTQVIVFRKQRQFDAAEECIEFGRRTFAKVEVTGVATGWMSLPMTAGEERMSVRLDTVKRHLVVKSASTRALMLDGVSPGDWVRMRLADGSFEQGRLTGYSGGSVQCVEPRIENGKIVRTQQSISILDVVELDGMQRNMQALRALGDVQDREPVIITFWPTGRQVIGRIAGRDGELVGVDVDRDREADVFVHPDLPVAAVTRVPVAFRTEAAGLEVGHYARVASTEQFPDAVVEHERRGRVVAVTSYSVSFATDRGARIMPFSELRALERLEGLDRRAIEDNSDRRDPERLECDLTVLPGAPAADGVDLDPESGVSVVTRRRKISHVFVSAPFQGSVFGLRIGADAEHSIRELRLRFDTRVQPLAGEDGAYRPVELVSTVVDGLTVTLLVDPRGQISAIQLSARE